MVTDAELATLARDIESDRVERKESIKNPNQIRTAICQFANDMPDHREPGVIFVGLKDNGGYANLQVTEELINTLAHMRGDGRILPLPTMTVQRRLIHGCEVAVVEVYPSDSPPVRLDGRVWIRVGARRAIATEEEERRLLEKRRAGVLSFDRQPARNATLDDLDVDLFERVYLPSAVAPDVLAANQRTVEQQFRSLHFLTSDGVPNYGALIVLGKDTTAWLPGAYIQLVRLEGTELTDPIRHQRRISGPLPDMLRLLDEILDANISLATDIVRQPTEVRHPDYPVVAIQQIARNAVMHRTYEATNAPVRIYWFSDRIEIQSPGGPYGQVTCENFGSPGVTDYRNPLVAEAMRALGYVQQFGIGIPLAQRVLEANGNPPLELVPESSTVLVILRRRP